LKIIFFCFFNVKFELLTKSGPNYKIFIFLMLCHYSNIALQSIFSNCTPSNFNEAHKCLLIAFCFESSLLQYAILEGMINILCQSFMRCNQSIYHSLVPSQNSQASYNDLFHFHASIFFTNSSNSAQLASLSTTLNPKFIINLSNHCFKGSGLFIPCTN
jgi:hypothetical protein